MSQNAQNPMTNYYELLDIRQNASAQDIKRAFREQAKRLHPDIAGETGADKMRTLLAAYETLSDRERRFEYDKAYSRFTSKYRFDYRTFLKERKEDPESQSKLIFFELLHLQEDTALEIWQEQGGLDFPMERYLDREDWMDCSFLLAEELIKRNSYYEGFVILVQLIREERRRPYFKHFLEEVEGLLKELVRLRLKTALDTDLYLECLEALLGLGFNSPYEARILRSIAETLVQIGDLKGASKAFKEALRKDPSLPNTVQLRRKLQV
ncbi:MAG: DnaJ domain-containing protein [Treponema sp.]|nr:DnaJ domain-containing protein [Treponema sp.]